MVDEIKKVKEGLKAALEKIEGPPQLRVFDQPPESVSQFPCVVIFTEPIDYEEVFTGRTFTGVFRAVLLLQKGDASKTFDNLDDYLNPVGPKSIKAAVEADRTLGGVADSATIVRRAENINFREVKPGQWYVGADFLISYMVSILP